MARFARISLIVVTGLLVAATAFANIPLPEACVVPDAVTITPDASFGYTLTVNGTQGPVNGSFVELRFSGEADQVLCWCVGQGRPTVSNFTDISGNVTFFIAGGGCIREDDLDTNQIVQVLADGVEIGRVFVNSPDVVNGQGLEYIERYSGDPNPNYVADAQCIVGITDAVYFTGTIVNASIDFCSNFTGPNYGDATGVSDAVIITGYIVAATQCTAQ